MLVSMMKERVELSLLLILERIYHSHPIGSIISHKCSSMIKSLCREANYGNDMGRCMCMAPPTAFILALKILAGREKDLADCRILLPQTHIRTRRQAQRVLDRCILPDAQQDEAETIEYSLNVLFGSESQGGI
jgi:hypothetical protein